MIGVGEVPLPHGTCKQGMVVKPVGDFHLLDDELINTFSSLKWWLTHQPTNMKHGNQAGPGYINNTLGH